MGVILSLCYGTIAYACFLGTFLYVIGFVGDIGVAKTIDSGTPAPLAEALVVNVLLLALFAAQHSLMARRSFKRWWTRIVPAEVERSTYVLAAAAALALLVWQWRPIVAPVIWQVRSDAGVYVIWAIFAMGWAVLFISSFLIDHFELFGVRQTLSAVIGQKLPEPEFRTPYFYRYVRHPLYLGFLLGAWATPVMTAGHLLFAVATTGYILLGIGFEERDLIVQFGERYRGYRHQVGMLVPWRKTRSEES